MDDERLWTKDFILVSIVNFVLMLSMYLLLVTMATYAVKEYNASISLGGLVAGIFVIGTLMGRLFAGKRIMQMGSKKMMIIGITIFLIFMIFYFLPIGVYPLVILRLLQGTGLGIATTATGTIISQVIPLSRSGEGIGYFSMSVVLATAIGPLVGVLMVEAYGYNSIFALSLIIAFLSLLLSFIVKPPFVEAPEEDHTDNKKFKLSHYFEMNALPISVVMFIAALAYSGILSFITGYTEEIGLVTAGSFYFLVYAIVVLLTRPFTGPLLDRKGGNSISYVAFVLFAIGLVMISQATTGLVLLLAGAIIGLGYGNFQSTAQAIAIKLTPPHRMGLANSTYFIGLDFGLGVGPFLLGYIVPVTGFRGMYLMLAVVALVGLGVYHIIYGRKEKELLGYADHEIENVS